MEAKLSIWLAASLLLFKLVMPFIPSMRRCIRSTLLLKNNEANNLTEANEQREEITVVAAAAKVANFRLLAVAGNEEEEEEGVSELVQLPDHMIESLLLPQLPVRTLLRFRTVSKQWNYTISNPPFSTHHMINISHVVYLDRSEQRRFFFPSKYSQLQAAPIPAAHQLSSSSPPLPLVQKRHPYSLPLLSSFKRKPFKSRVLRYILSCNGLVCFLMTRHNRIQSIHDVSIQILNLATNKRRLVGELPDDVLDMMRGCNVRVETTMLGFGFDPTINDFKIVFMFRSADRGPWITRVMSLKTNIWRKVDYLSSNYHDLSRVKLGHRISQNVAVAGGVFMSVTIDDYTHHAILKFSLADERFELISFLNKQLLHTLACHGRSLYLFANMYDVPRIDLWMLPMGSASNVWKKVTTIIPPPPPPRESYFQIPPSYSLCDPLGIDCNGHVIIVVDQVLHAYLLKERKFVKLDSSSNCDYLHLVQTETLACP